MDDCAPRKDEHLMERIEEISYGFDMKLQRLGNSKCMFCVLLRNHGEI